MDRKVGGKSGAELRGRGQGGGPILTTGCRCPSLVARRGRDGDTEALDMPRVANPVSGGGGSTRTPVAGKIAGSLSTESELRTNCQVLGNSEIKPNRLP